MAKTAHQLSAQKQARRLRAAVAHRRAMNIKRASEPLIPTHVLKALSELHLPRNKRLYTKHLRQLLNTLPSSGQLLMIPSMTDPPAARGVPPTAAGSFCGK
jgi:hypothetical protein